MPGFSAFDRYLPAPRRRGRRRGKAQRPYGSWQRQQLESLWRRGALGRIVLVAAILAAAASLSPFVYAAQAREASKQRGGARPHPPAEVREARADAERRGENDRKRKVRGNHRSDRCRHVYLLTWHDTGIPTSDPCPRCIAESEAAVRLALLEPEAFDVRLAPKRPEPLEWEEAEMLRGAGLTLRSVATHPFHDLVYLPVRVGRLDEHLDSPRGRQRVFVGGRWRWITVKGRETEPVWQGGVS